MCTLLHITSSSGADRRSRSEKTQPIQSPQHPPPHPFHITIQVARTHVALLVHGLFNAAIAREDMGAGFAFHHPHDEGGSGAAYWCVLA